MVAAGATFGIKGHIVVKTIAIAFVVDMDQSVINHTYFIIASVFITTFTSDLRRFHVNHGFIVVVVLHSSRSCLAYSNLDSFVKMVESLLDFGCFITMVFDHLFAMVNYVRKIGSWIVSFYLCTKYWCGVCIRIPCS